MNVTSVGSTAFCATPNYSKLINRKMLQSTTSSLKPLLGPAEKSEAKWWVAAYTASNAAIAGATAQAAGAEELLLAGVEVGMAAHIFNVIYDFKLSKTMLKSLAAGVAGHAVGKTTFKMASKALTWIPGLGNGLNATIAGITTGALGAALIEMAEDMDKARKNGEKLEDFFKKLEKK